MAKHDHSSQNNATFSALLILLVVMGGILFLIALVFPNVLAVLGIVFGFGFLFAIQYLIWGRWLMGYLKERVPDDSEEEEKFLKKYGPQ